MNALRNSNDLAPGGFAPQPRALTAGEFGLGLQLSRAGLMALARLQLAIRSGDRQQAMAAMDRLHTVDGEIERLVGRLPHDSDAPGPAGDDDETAWTALAAHLGDQKLALAFEKLALASEISGPDLVSTPPFPQPGEAHPLVRPDDEPPPPLPLWPTRAEAEPTPWKPSAAGVYGAIFAFVVMAVMVTAALLTIGR